MDSHNNIKTKSFFLSLPFLFVLYVTLCILGILAYRYFITQTPLFEHTFVELISRGVILVFYLFVVNLPAFFLVFIPILRQNLVVFGVCLALVVAFSLTGLPATLCLSSQIFMIPWFVIWESFVVVSIVCVAFFRNTPAFNASIALFQALKSSLAFALVLYFLHFVWYFRFIFLTDMISSVETTGYHFIKKFYFKI